jgi:hypothetical protein
MVSFRTTTRYLPIPLCTQIGQQFQLMQQLCRSLCVQSTDSSWAYLYVGRTFFRVATKLDEFFLGREPDWCDLNIMYTISIFSNGMLINVFPKFMHPVVGRIFSGRRAAMRRTKRYLKPIIEERLRQMQEQSEKEWPDKPVCLITRFSPSSDKII